MPTKHKAAHSPLPWRADGFYILRGSQKGTQVIAEVSHDRQGLYRGHETNEANTVLIVRAVNCHADLVAACEAAIFALEGHGSITAQCRAAVAKAQEH